MALCYSTSRAAVELARNMIEHIGGPRAQIVLAEFPGPPVLLGSSQGVPRSSSGAMQAMEYLREVKFQTVFFSNTHFPHPSVNSRRYSPLGPLCETPSNTGNAQAWLTRGVFFFGDFLLDKQKKVTSTGAAPRRFKEVANCRCRPPEN